MAFGCPGPDVRNAERNPAAGEQNGCRKASPRQPGGGATGGRAPRIGRGFNKLRVAVRVQNAFDVSNVIASHDFIATMPERQARMLAQKFPLEILRLPLSVPDMRIAMYWHEHSHKEPTHRWFRERVAEIAKAL
jgi:DNA-binding transcriptional LysR family regulator